MEIKVLGLKINVLNAAIFLVLGFLVSTLTVYSCAKVNSIKEAMDVIKGENKDEEKKEEKNSNNSSFHQTSMMDDTQTVPMHEGHMDR